MRCLLPLELRHYVTFQVHLRVCVCSLVSLTYTCTHTCTHTHINTHTSMFGEKERRYVSSLESALMFLQRESFLPHLFGLVHVLIDLASSILLLDEGWGSDKCQPNMMLSFLGQCISWMIHIWHFIRFSVWLYGANRMRETSILEIFF